jgi:hypothetical protein
MQTAKEYDIKDRGKWMVEQYPDLKEAMYHNEYRPLLIQHHMRGPLGNAIAAIYGDKFGVYQLEIEVWRHKDTTFDYVVFIKGKKPTAKDYEVIRAIVQSIKSALS